MTKRYIVLEFDDEDDPSFGGTASYDPPLPHPADMFIDGMEHDYYFWTNVGAVQYAECSPPHPHTMDQMKRPTPEYSRGWLDSK